MTTLRTRFMRYTTMLTSLSIMMLFAGASGASAQSTVTAVAVGDYLGCANFDLFAGLTAITSQFTGWMIAGGVILALLLIAAGSLQVMIAKKNEDLSSSGLTKIRNAVLGLALLIIGLPILAIVISGAVLAFC